jgi:hypothetical protein
MLSYRKTLTYDFDYNFKSQGFQNYLEGDIRADRLIIQLESLLRLDFVDPFSSLVPKYDLVIMDESESILKQFSSHKTFKGTERDSFEYLQKILYNSKKIITLDGDQGNATYSFTNTLGKSINLNNKVITHNYEIALVDHLQTWKDEIINDLKKNNKIVVASMSASEITIFYEELIKQYPNKTIYLYTGNTDMKKKADDSKDIKKAWQGADCVLYSSCFESGVNYDVEGHFNKIYGYLTTCGTSQRGFYQMISRVRNVTSNKIMTYKGDLADNDVQDFYTFDEVKKEMIAGREKILKYIYTLENG